MTRPGRLAEALLDLVLPRCCAGCRAPGTGLCAGCRTLLAGPVLGRVPDGPAGLPPLCAVGRYDGALRGVLLAHKEQGRLALVRPLGRALAGAVRAADPPAGAVLVPVPSAVASVRARGHDHARRLASRVGAELQLPARPLLRQVRPVTDSAGLSAVERARNLRGALAARRPLQGVTAVVVDDVVTTGATLREAVRALRAAGAQVPAVAVVAATPARRRAAAPDGPTGSVQALPGALRFGSADRAGARAAAHPDRMERPGFDTWIPPPQLEEDLRGHRGQGPQRRGAGALP